MFRYNAIVFLLPLFFNACQSDNSQIETVEPEKVVEEKYDRFTLQRFEYYKQANRAIDENNDSLFRVTADWFLIYSKDPMSFVPYANRMALINNSKYGYYYYFALHEENLEIDLNDNLFVNHLFWYLAKSRELGMAKNRHKYSNEVFNQEIRESDYYLQKM